MIAVDVIRNAPIPSYPNAHFTQKAYIKHISHQITESEPERYRSREVKEDPGNGNAKNAE